MGADVARAGVNKRSWYNERFGADTVATFEPRLASAFAKAGIEGAYTLDGNTGDTRPAHRVAAYAEETHGPAAQDAFMRAMFHRYFIEALAPCDEAVMRDAASAAGLDEAVVSKVLADGEASPFETVVEEQMSATRARVRGVPHFIITCDGDGASRKIEIGGAQPPEAFLDAFAELLDLDADDVAATKS